MHASPSAAVATSGPARNPTASRLVIDAPMRMFHWLFALSFVGAYVTAESEHWRLLHATLGYAFAGLLVFRLLYGIFGPRQAALGLLWRRLAGVPAWLRSVVAARSFSAVNWRQGQSLTMALAIVSMLAICTIWDRSMLRPAAISPWDTPCPPIRLERSSISSFRWAST